MAPQQTRGVIVLLSNTLLDYFTVLTSPSWHIQFIASILTAAVLFVVLSEFLAYRSRTPRQHTDIKQKHFQGPDATDPPDRPGGGRSVKIIHIEKVDAGMALFDRHVISIWKTKKIEEESDDGLTKNLNAVFAVEIKSYQFNYIADIIFINAIIGSSLLRSGWSVIATIDDGDQLVDIHYLRNKIDKFYIFIVNEKVVGVIDCLSVEPEAMAHKWRVGEHIQVAFTPVLPSANNTNFDHISVTVLLKRAGNTLARQAMWGEAEDGKLIPTRIHGHRLMDTSDLDFTSGLMKGNKSGGVYQRLRKDAALDKGGSSTILDELNLQLYKLASCYLEMGKRDIEMRLAELRTAQNTGMLNMPKATVISARFREKTSVPRIPAASPEAALFIRPVVSSSGPQRFDLIEQGDESRLTKLLAAMAVVLTMTPSPEVFSVERERAKIKAQQACSIFDSSWPTKLAEELDVSGPDVFDAANLQSRENGEAFGMSHPPSPITDQAKQGDMIIEPAQEGVIQWPLHEFNCLN